MEIDQQQLMTILNHPEIRERSTFPEEAQCWISLPEAIGEEAQEILERIESTFELALAPQ